MTARRKRKQRRSALLAWLVPPVVVAAAVFLSPREGDGPRPTGLDQSSMGLRQDSLVEGRNYDWIVMDSLLKLMDQVDPAQQQAQRSQTKDTLTVVMPMVKEKASAARIFLNQSDPAGYVKLLTETTPFRVRKKDDRHFAFHFPIQKKGDLFMVPVPFDMLAGMLTELRIRKKNSRLK